MPKTTTARRGWRDLNSRLPVRQTGALDQLSHILTKGRMSLVRGEKRRPVSPNSRDDIHPQTIYLALIQFSRFRKNSLDDHLTVWASHSVYLLSASLHLGFGHSSIRTSSQDWFNKLAGFWLVCSMSCFGLLVYYKTCYKIVKGFFKLFSRFFWTGRTIFLIKSRFL